MALHLDSGSFLGTVGATASLGGILLREIVHEPSAKLPTHVHELHTSALLWMASWMSGAAGLLRDVVRAREYSIPPGSSIPT